ncbi:DUF2335 domain-containing protein [Caenispirillum bisanense]|uniref:DUF2335 domain-containing protein n=1 Tax=Caenispirillum bisanense TaxID=414052 RepID=UPI0031D21F04
MVQSDGATVPPPPPEETAPGELERLLQALPPDEARELRTALVQSSSFRRPLPPPALLAHYEDILPGAADRIMTMAEAEQAHRIWWERRDMATASNTALGGLVLGFVALLALIGGAVYSIAIGSEVGAGLFLGVGVIGVIGRFLSHRWNNGGDGQARS